MHLVPTGLKYVPILFGIYFDSSCIFFALGIFSFWILRLGLMNKLRISAELHSDRANSVSAPKPLKSNGAIPRLLEFLTHSCPIKGSDLISRSDNARIFPLPSENARLEDLFWLAFTSQTARMFNLVCNICQFSGVFTYGVYSLTVLPLLAGFLLIF
jgi:hypothetical protein